MLNSKHPSVEQLGKYMENFSAKKRFPAYSIGRGMRQVRSSASVPNLSPGMYRTDVDFVMNEKTEFDATAFGAKPSSWTIGLDSRVTSDGVLKGIASSVPGNSGLGAGQYTLPEARRLVTHKNSSPTYIWNKSVESQEELRARKAGTDVPGPGTYRTYSTIEMDEETKKFQEKAAKKIETTWAASQYSHMFAVMRPKAPVKKGQHEGGGGALKPFK